MGSDADLNLYAYVAGDPINSTDPIGLFPNCSAYQKAGGGAREDIYDEHKDKKTGEIVKGDKVIGLKIDELPSKNLADEHYRSNDGLFFEVPTSAVISGANVDWATLQKKWEIFCRIWQ